MPVKSPELNKIEIIWHLLEVEVNENPCVLKRKPLN